MSSVIVSNIAPNTTEVTISEFFSFCGKITGLHVSPKEDGSLQAVVTFESPSAAKTSLLLTNALINDRPIIVELAPEEIAQQSGTPAHTENPNIVNKAHQLPADQRSSTSVVASMLAAGYKLGDGALGSARDLDAKIGFSAKVASVATATKEKFSELDQNLGVSDKAKAFSDAVGSKVSAIDESLGVSQKARAAAAAADSMFNNLARAAATSFEDFINKGVSVAQTNFPNAYQNIQNAGASVSGAISSVKVEADRKYEEDKAAAGGYSHVSANGEIAAPDQEPLVDLSDEGVQQEVVDPELPVSETSPLTGPQ